MPHAGLGGLQPSRHREAFNPKNKRKSAPKLVGHCDRQTAYAHDSRRARRILAHVLFIYRRIVFIHFNTRVWIARRYVSATSRTNTRVNRNPGNFYADGKGVAKGDAKAIEWYTRAAEQADGGAQNTLASMKR